MAAFTTVFNDMKQQIDDILRRLGLLETDMSGVKAKNCERSAMTITTMSLPAKSSRPSNARSTK